MSIINDALKKVQVNLKNRPAPARPRYNPTVTNQPISTAPSHPAPPTIRPHPAPRPSSFVNAAKKTLSSATSAIPDHLVLPGLLLLGIPFLILVYLFVGQLSRNFHANRIRIGAEITDGSIVLNGIMTMDSKKVALINNTIYEMGESIGDMTLVGISVDYVQLLRDGTIRTLKIKK